MKTTKEAMKKRGNNADTISSPRIVLVGVGGAGLSGLAGLLLELGFTNLVGIDQSLGARCKELKEQGVTIIVGHGNYTIKPTDFVVYSRATHTSPEVLQAQEHYKNDHIKSTPPMLYAEFLGELSKYFRTIAITGTHGKTTTTGIAAHALEATTQDFGIGIVGSTMSDRDGKGYRLNTTHTATVKQIIHHIISRKGTALNDAMVRKLRFVVEADEYNKHFLRYDQEYAIITNCEIDHVDTYKDTQTYLTTFIKFMQNTHSAIIIPDNLPDLVAQYRALDNTLADLIEAPIQKFSFKHLFGGHNHTNASLVYTLLTHLYPNKTTTINDALCGFKGLGRRCEPIGTNAHNIPIISDYGHHPTEITSTLAMIRKKHPNKHITVFCEIHQLIRAIQFRDEFPQALNGADTVYLTPIYHAREDYTAIQNKHPNHPITDSPTVKDFQIATAKQRNITSITDETAIPDQLHTIDTGLIVLFTAGKLDGIVREGLK